MKETSDLWCYNMEFTRTLKCSHSCASTGKPWKEVGGGVIWVYGEILLDCAHRKLVRLPTKLVATDGKSPGDK